MILALSYFYRYLLIYLLAEMAIKFATSFGKSLWQQKTDGEALDWKKALKSGIDPAISAAYTPSKIGSYARDFHCLDQAFRRRKAYSFC